jgi:hypothetical protein
MVGSGGPLNPHDAKPGLAARIVGGRVYSEDQSYQSNGAVSANGVIRVTVAGFGRSASGSGRLSHNSSAGHWWSSREECSRNGMIRPCSLPASDESGKGRQRQGAPPCQSCHASSPLRPMCSDPAWCHPGFGRRLAPARRADRSLIKSAVAYGDRFN